MQYSTLGKTGLKVSRLGFGAMRLPMVGEGEASRVDRELAIPMIHRAFDAGVNYIDTAVGYCNSDSQVAVGEALKGYRNKIIVSTKNHDYGESESQWWKNLEDSLQRLDVGYIDIYNHHGISWESFTKNVEPRISKWMQKALDQGLIKHICNSYHDTGENLIKLIDADYSESITLQYNLFNREMEKAIAYAKEKNIGVVVMGPVAGGRLGNASPVLEKILPEVKRVPELALRFVLSNPGVTIALSGMSTMQQVEENLITASDESPLSPEDSKAIDTHMKRLKAMADLYCTGCGYCQPCPNDVAISTVFERYNEGRIYGLWDFAKKEYNLIGAVYWYKGAKADACIECGECLEKCPQNIPIIDQLKEAHEALGGGA